MPAIRPERGSILHGDSAAWADVAIHCPTIGLHACRHKLSRENRDLHHRLAKGRERIRKAVTKHGKNRIKWSSETTTDTVTRAYSEQLATSIATRCTAFLVPTTWRVRLLTLRRSARSDGAQAVVARNADIDPMRLVRWKIPVEKARGAPIHSVDDDRLSPSFWCAKDRFPALLRFEVSRSLPPGLECLHRRGRPHHQKRKRSGQNAIHHHPSGAKH
jgi:hypothetical protein